MARLRIAPIVEGHGEVESIRILLDRIWRDELGGEYVEVIRPVRCKRNKLIRKTARESDAQLDADEIRRVVTLARNKLADKNEHDLAMRAMILVLLDADEDCPKDLAPLWASCTADAAGEFDSSFVLAKREFETWFVGAADSLMDLLEIGSGEIPPPDPEGHGAGKRWIEEHMKSGHYSPTVDQPRLTNRMDLQRCRERCPSFDKLCRDLKRCIEAEV